MADATGPELPAEPAVPPELPAEPVLTTVRCPHCDAELRNARVEPGQALRCLNCGKRFTPLAAAGGVEDAENPAQPARMFPREVRAPGYWLLRIPAILACFASCLTFAITTVSYLQFAGNFRFMELVLMSYLPLLPIAGLIQVWLTQSLARTDAGMAATLERRKPGSADIPPLSGSSLPYILPLAVIGGILPIIAFNLEGTTEQVFVVSLIGGGLFFTAFAQEDLRQFLWRQIHLLERLSGNPLLERRGNFSSLGISAVSFVLFILVLITFEGMSGNDRQVFTFVLVTVLGCTYALARMDSIFSRVASSAPEELFLLSSRFYVLTVYCMIAIAAVSFSADFINNGKWTTHQPRSSFIARAIWNAFLMGPPAGLALYLMRFRLAVPAGVSALERWMPRVPMIWCAIALLLVGYLWLNESRFIRRFHESMIGATIGAAVLFAALWVGDLLARVISWRRSVEQRLDISPQPLKSYQNTFVWITSGCVFLQMVLLFLYFVDTTWRIRFEEILLVPLAGLLIHYPTLWLLQILYQFWRVEAALKAEREGANEAALE